MLPDLAWMIIPIGPIHIQVWGLFVALGILVALLVAKQFARQRQLNEQWIVDGAFWIVLFALLSSRVWYVLTEWQQFAGRMLDVLKVWQGGMSFSGGLLGAAVAGFIYFHYKKVKVLEYVDILLYVLPLGLAIGRLGCFFIFDHPGTVTDFWLGEVYYLDGLVRHNHGLYLAIDGAVLFALFTYLRFKAKIKAPYFLTIYLLWEGIVRLWLDSDRINDSQWYGLTAAQWLGIVMIILGLVVFGTRQNIRKRYL